MTKPKRLRAIKLDEVSLVDRGANQGARVVMYKRAPEGEEIVKGKDYDKGAMTDAEKRKIRDLMEKENMTEDEAVASVMGKSDSESNPDNGAGSPGSTEASVNKEGEMTPEELEKRLGELEDQLAAVTKAAEAEGFDVAKSDEGEITLSKREEPEMIEVEGELIEKSAVPAPMLKALDRIAKLEAEAERETLAKRAEAELPNLAGSVESRGALLKAVDGLDGSVRDEVLKSLKAADAAVRMQFVEVGKTAHGDADPNDPQARVEALAKAEIEAGRASTMEQGRANVWKTAEGQKLRAAIRAH